MVTTCLYCSGPHPWWECRKAPEGWKPPPKSTAARKDVRQGKAGTERVDTPAPLTQQGFATPDNLGDEMGRPQSATLQSEISARASYSRADTLEQAGTQAPPVDTTAGERLIDSAKEAAEILRKPGRPKTITDMKAYKADKARVRRAAAKEAKKP